MLQVPFEDMGDKAFDRMTMECGTDMTSVVDIAQERLETGDDVVVVLADAVMAGMMVSHRYTRGAAMTLAIARGKYLRTVTRR